MHDHLADKLQVILIVRLVSDTRGQLLYGEIVDVEGTVIGRFAEWQRLWTTNTKVARQPAYRTH
jgi:hypothetical protein